MDIMKRFLSNQEEIKNLKQQLQKANENLDNYNKEKEKIDKQLNQLEKKYKVLASRKLIEDIPTKIIDLENNIYIYFLQQLCFLDRKAERKKVYIDIDHILDERGVYLYPSLDDDFDYSEMYYDEKGNSLEEYDSSDYESRTVLEFNRRFEIEDLQNILDDIDILISIFAIYNLLKTNIKNGMVSGDLSNMFKKHNIELYNKDISLMDISFEKLADRYILKNNENVIFSVSKKANYDKLFKSLEEELKILNIKLENDEDYKEYLRLKSIFE